MYTSLLFCCTHIFDGACLPKYYQIWENKSQEIEDIQVRSDFFFQLPTQQFGGVFNPEN
jgi:hypothetical protein